jgi:PAS domain S-box-containing protein
MLRDGQPNGVISVSRREAGAFAANEVELLQTFADQAVIAIENVRLLNETREALERQTATADILKVIASSPSDVQPVFDAIAESAKRLLVSHSAVVTRVIDDVVHLAASTAETEAPAHAAQGLLPYPLSSDRIHARVARTGQLAVNTDAPNSDLPREIKEFARTVGWRSMLVVPMLRNGIAIGTIGITRREAGSFDDKTIDFLKIFADQAVIAIENARLFNETKEALARQTATSDILRVISQSPTDVQPVFDAIVLASVRLLRCDRSVFIRCDTTSFWQVALAGSKGLLKIVDSGKDPIDPDAHFPSRAIVAKKTLHLPDWSTVDLPVYERRIHETYGINSALYLPLVRAGECIGVLALAGKRSGMFGESDVALAESFRDQALIAIENTRLFNETQESLQQQTATADVLKIINRSSVDLETVLDTLVETVTRLCRADYSTMYRQRDDKYHLVAAYGALEEVKEFVRTHPFVPDRGTLTGRVGLEHRVVHIPDALSDPEYTYHELQKIAGYRSMLGVPLLRGDELIGIFSLHRTRVEPFTSKEIDLASSFADQAMIAIENARLFEELRERQAELRVTFDNMGDGVVMFDTEALLTAWNRNFQQMLDLPDAFLAGRPSSAEYFRYLADRGEYSTDLEAQLSHTIEDTRREMRFERTRPDGRVMEVRRNPVPGGGFVLIYADITERKRAEETIRIARDAAEAALRDLQTAQDRLIQTEKLASLGQLTAGIAHEIKNPLNFVNNFSALSAELTDELNDVLKPVAMDGKIRGEVDELTGLLKGNLEKVVQHGKRADSIVKNMLLHSREGSREHRSADINSLLDESLNLAYHGARAEKGEFNITLQRDFDADAGTIEVFPQEITRAFLNLIANGVYAATRRQNENKEPGFEPTLRATTKNLGTAVEIRIRDNGTGIPPEVQEKMFNPFFTTKPAGEGTGLGLSMTHDIIVKQHGGKIDVETEPGQFTEFRIVLPRTAATGKAGADK